MILQWPVDIRTNGDDLSDSRSAMAEGLQNVWSKVSATALLFELHM